MLNVFFCIVLCNNLDNSLLLMLILLFLFGLIFFLKNKLNSTVYDDY